MGPPRSAAGGDALITFPSIALIAWLADIVSRRFGRPLFSTRERSTLVVSLAVLAIALYPGALGYVKVDVYRFGFTPFAPMVLAVAGVALAIRREFRLAIFVLAALVAIDVELLRSANVFDYLVDPVSGFCAVVWLSARPLMRLRPGAFDATRESGATGSGPAA